MRTKIFFTSMFLIGLLAVSCQRPARLQPTAISPAETASESFAPGNYTLSLGPDGDQRNVILHLPPTYDNSSMLPLIIVLHGGGGSGEQIHGQTEMDADADHYGFVVAYPDGSGRLGDALLTWNAGYCCGYALDKNIDDVGFLSTLIDQLLANYSIDPDGVYVTGMSNGAMMAYRAGAELSEKIAGIAPVSGSIGGQARVKYPAVFPEPPAEPVAVIAFHGMQDQHVLYNGGVGPEAINQGRIDFSVEKSISFWVEADGCNPEPTTEIMADGNIIIDTFSGCEADTEVVLVTIVDGGMLGPVQSPQSVTRLTKTFQPMR
jgi:polyhydroxybutyrate depolymerase